ncbi:hypothetical protein Dimus_037785 [Dionaea muscipula]
MPMIKTRTNAQLRRKAIDSIKKVWNFSTHCSNPQAPFIYPTLTALFSYDIASAFHSFLLFFLYLIGLKEAIDSEDPKMLYFRRSYPELPFQYFHRLKAR